MNSFVRLLAASFLILVFCTSIAFSYYNTVPVSLVFGVWQSPQLPVSIWVLSAFIAGGGLGLLLGLRFFKNLKSRVEIRRLQKEVASSNAELKRLRSLPLQDIE